MRKAKTTAEKMIKVDHAGENGAVNIYRAQIFVAGFRAREWRSHLKDFLRHELNHRAIFTRYLRENGIRKCVSYHICGFGGYVLGLVTGLIGPNAIAATTYAVEHVVIKHLSHQVEYLKTNDIAAHDCVCKIIADEQEHLDTAKTRLTQNNIFTPLLIRIVSACTESVIRFGMR